MAVVKMSKFSAIGIDTVKESLMSRLMESGVTELSSQESKLSDADWSRLTAVEDRSAIISELQDKLKIADNALNTLSLYDTSKKPLFSSRKPVTESEFSMTEEEQAALCAQIREVYSLASNIKDLQTSRNSIETEILALKPWIDYQIPLEIQETKRTCALIGGLPPRLDLSRLKSSLTEITDLFELSLIGSGAEQHCVSLICMMEKYEEIEAALTEYGFIRAHFHGLSGSAAENIASLESELVKIAAETAAIEKRLADLAARKGEFELFYDFLTVRHDREKAFDNMLVTGRAFYIDGWIPENEAGNLTAILDEYGCHHEVTAPEKDEETPVLLKNNRLIAPLESITNLYDIPNSREIDPTPIYAFFYICFFGIMFADIAYGAILAGICFTAVKAWKMEGNARKFITQLGYCGVSTLIWGVMFGSFFGNLVPVASETFLGESVHITPLWINPVEDSMTMLIFSCLCGVVHLFVALGVKAYSLIREGRLIEAVNDAFLWYLLIAGLGLLIAGEHLFPGAASIGKWLSIAGAGGIVLLPAFTGKGAGKAVGLWNLYGITRYISDILSYARLLALCLSGSVIAQVFNIIAALPGSGAIGLILFILIAALAHVFNFLCSALGAFVHSIRLQYVEFFGKFYEGKGMPFRPFMKNTKYVKIIKEGN